MTEGIAHTPTQTDSHEELQARQGWSVAAMREEIDAKGQEIDKLKRTLANYEIRSHNALEFLRLVNCGNVDQGKVASAIAELNDIQRSKTPLEPVIKTMKAGEMAQDQTCFVKVSTLAPFDKMDDEDFVLFEMVGFEGRYIQLHKSDPVSVINLNDIQRGRENG